MTRGVNKVILVGNVGQDPVVRFTQGGDAIANISLATSERWKDQHGQQQEKTEWHRIVVFGKLAEIAQQLVRKGSKLYIEGKLQTRKWQDNNGQDRYTTEIVVNGYGGVMNMLDGRQGDGQQQHQHYQHSARQQSPYSNTQQSNQAEPQQQPQQAQYDQYDRSIPF